MAVTAEAIWLTCLCVLLGAAGCDDDSAEVSPDAAMDAGLPEGGTNNRQDAAVVDAPDEVEDVRVQLPDLPIADAQIPTPMEIFASVNGLRWELPCSNNANDFCDTPAAQVKETQLGGPVGAQYDVTLRFRGVVEEKTYADPVIGSHWLVGGGGPAADLYNVYQLEISDPPQIFYLNNGDSNQRICYPIDYTKTIRLAAGTTVTLTADPVDDTQVENRDDNGIPIVIPAIAPAPAAYNGQFIQMDVVSVTRLQ